MLLFFTVMRVIFHLIIACTGLALMVLFVQHQPDVDAGMKYIYFYCVPVLAIFTVTVSSVAIHDYLHPEEDEAQESESE